MDRLTELMTGVKLGRAGSTTLTNYNTDGEKIMICLRLYPLYTDSMLTHYLGVVEPVQTNKFNTNGNVSSAGHTTEGEYICVCVNIYVYVHVCVSVNIYIYMYIYIYILVYIYSFIYCRVIIVIIIISKAGNER
jgi:hypothetical protein